MIYLIVKIVHERKIVAVGDQEVEVYCAAKKSDQLVAPLVLNIPHPDELIPFIEFGELAR